MVLYTLARYIHSGSIESISSFVLFFLPVQGGELLLSTPLLFPLDMSFQTRTCVCLQILAKHLQYLVPVDVRAARPFGREISKLN